MYVIALLLLSKKHGTPLAIFARFVYQAAAQGKVPQAMDDIWLAGDGTPKWPYDNRYC